MTRDEAIKYLIKPVSTSTEPSEEYRKQKEAYNMAIEALEKKKIGSWLWDDFKLSCSACGEVALMGDFVGAYYASNYCPSCGARMDEDDDNDDN
ncbi:MAG: hypothetical protein IKE34_12555 [Paenibacillus sp.]|nr:hypothetical protein [Paenibacillus sp.]